MHTFHTPISHIPLPEQFTYPFHYTPHPLCVLATEEVQAYLHTRPEWHEELQHGKMFGVLVVQDNEGRIGYLAAFSGNLAGSNHHPFFVPPVYDLLDPDGYFKQEEAQISALNHTIQQCHPDDRREEGSREHPVTSPPYNHINSTHVNAPEILRFAQDDKGRKAQDDKGRKALYDKGRRTQDDINVLKEERKNRSIALQQWIFRQFRLLNARGEAKDIEQIFAETARRNPPAGTGECAAPKLLQYAYLHGLQPLAMAEWWWGDSPKGEIRRHGHYYPSCRHKCEPILGHMLQGLDVEPNPLLVSNTDATQLLTVYEDDYLLVVNKPAGMLSVPGKTGQASVLSILQERYPDATGPLLVHRLDMDTSGLLLAAKDKDIHAQLQAQFESRSVKKRYLALLEGVPQGKEPRGFIRLPMRPDFDNRPYQLVDFEYGKPAVTRYEILSPLTDETSKERTRIHYYPETGRTHQLRVHSAHPDGLGCPIVGDPLYGQPSDRLCLHAEYLEFRHPISGKILKVHSEAAF